MPEIMLMLNEINENLKLLLEEEKSKPKIQPIYDTDEASCYLRVSKDFLYELIKKGKIQHRKKGNKGFLFKKEWLDQCLDNGFN